MSSRSNHVVSSTALPFIFIVIVVTVGFTGSLSGEFLNWDDDRNFVQNPAFRGLGLDQVRWAFTTFHLGVWQPLAWLLFSLQHACFGMDPRGYHAVSIALHAACSVMLFLVARTCLAVSGHKVFALTAWPSWVIALVVSCFALHPMRVEVVAWISCQPYLPAILTCLACLLVHLRVQSSSARSSWVTWIFPLVLYAIAVGFKAVAVTLPLVLVLCDVYPLRRWSHGAAAIRRSLLEKAPMFALSIIVCIVALRAKEFNASRAPLHEFDFSVRSAQAAAGAWFYLIKTIVPADLSPYYRLPDDLSLRNARTLGAVIGVAAVSAVLLLLRRRLPALTTAWFIYLAILAPNLGLIQISQQLAADRYGYFAMVGWVVVASGALALWTNRKTAFFRVVAASLMIVTVGCLLQLTRVQTKTWNTSDSLWRATLALDPVCAVAHCNLGEDLARRGEYAEATRHLSRAIDLDETFAFAYVNLGVVLCQARQYEDALRCGEHALSIEDGLHGLDRGRAHAMLGQAHAGLKQDDEAWRHTQEALRLGFEPARGMMDYLSQFSVPPK